MGAARRGVSAKGVRALRFAMSLGGALLAAGCIGPDMSEIGDMGAFRADLSQPQPRPVQIFIASTRKGDDGAASRELAGEAHFALASMTIPPGHRAGSIEEPLWGKPSASNDIVVTGERPMDGDEFRQELAAHLSGRIGSNRDVLLFVHGFNTSYEEARARAAQIVADSHFGGVAVLFTWPSQSELFGYVSDKDNAMASRDALQALMHDLGQTPGVGKIEILAHSMGGWLSMEALRQSAIGGDRTLSGKLGTVILASPDIDMDVFASQMARVKPARVIVLATPADRALSISSAIALSRPRVGAIDASKPEDRAEIENLGAKVVDISAYADADRFISHAVYADSPQVLSAIGTALAKSRPEDANAVSDMDAKSYQDPNPASSPIIAAPGSPEATAVAVSPLAPVGDALGSTGAKSAPAAPASGSVAAPATTDQKPSP
jgi:esterase/lipase superfamily enzyme